MNLPSHRCPRCGAVVAGRCPCHTWPVRSRIRGRTLQRLRDQLLARQPYCATCQRVLVWDWVRDHIVPLSEGGTDTEDNVQALCIDCHEVKRQQEAHRGMVRSR